MCGIFGMIGNVPDKYAGDMFNLLRNIFVVTQSRGNHASGFAAIFHDSPKLVIDKRPIDSSKFVDRSGKFNSLRTNLPAMMIGHCRHSTSGKPEIGRNNHPFTSKHQTLVHNGKIDEWKKVANELDISLRTQTDSEIILRIADRYHEPQDAVKAIVEGTNDAPMALAIMQHEQYAGRRLILFRNKERPLYLMRSPILNAIVFTSTADIMVTACKMTWKKTPEEIRSEFQIEDDELLEYNMATFELTDGNPDITNLVEIKKTVKMLPALPPRTVTIDGAAKEDVRAVYGFDLREMATDAASLATCDGPPPLPILGPTQPPQLIIPPEVLKDAANQRLGEMESAATDSTKILKLVRDVPYMTAIEIKHWRQFRHRIRT